MHERTCPVPDGPQGKCRRAAYEVSADTYATLTQSDAQHVLPVNPKYLPGA